MPPSRHRAVHVGLGVLALCAGAVWLLFVGVGLLWIWPYGLDLTLALVLGAALAIGITVFLAGVCELVGRWPGVRSRMILATIVLLPAAYSLARL